ncbi:Myosin [Phytophthora megakarya]|uniref:Myosin n=1 Tax=Phytophthora megakarya TaxID=4795 RepID=A0A225V424_9STRA|nr:Myosin [Phytophthora megakarya]
MWKIEEGDFLIAINECSTHSSSMTYESVMQVVATGARPAVLRFRRPTPEERRRIPTRKRKPTNEERLGRRRNRERLEKTLSYVIWREGDGPLGVSLKKHRDSLYPIVADMNRSSVVRPHASIGDVLISINQHEICKLGDKRWVHLLKSAPKPLVLTFRRLEAPVNQKGARTLDL